ncbi:MAG: hypothetical protein ACKOWO_04350, partial [Sediminibacterium sp.]
LTGEGNMIDEAKSFNNALAEEFTFKYEVENIKLQNLQEDVEQLNTVIKDKEKIISLYEFMLHQQPIATTTAVSSPNVF